jgi:hypothetical protein
VELQLDSSQADLLREVLDMALRDLRHEISSTDNMEYTRTLKEREQMMRSILERLQPSAASPS